MLSIVIIFRLVVFNIGSAIPININLINDSGIRKLFALAFD